MAYVRVSTEEQVRGGVSLDDQAERVRLYCALNGLDVVAMVREEGVSGGRPLRERPGGADLLRVLDRRDVRHVVALKLDRLFRDASDCLVQTRAWDKAGKALHLLDMGGQAINTGSAMGRMMLTMAAAFAELERNLISERTKSALRHKRAHRRVYNALPFGFDRDGDRLVENDAEQRVIARIKAEHAARRSLRRIADGLNADAVPTKRGGAWHASTVRAVLGNDLHRAA